MKNSTKVRLHLSKQLFESLTREIIKEAKANDGYTVAVKAPKQPKKIKEVNAVADTDKMKKMEEMEFNVAEEGKVDEYVGVETSTGLITALATLLGIGVPLATSLYKDLKGKTPQEKKQVLQSLGKQMDKISGNDSSVQKQEDPKQAVPKEAFSLNELRKQVKK